MVMGACEPVTDWLTAMLEGLQEVLGPRWLRGGSTVAPWWLRSGSAVAPRWLRGGSAVASRSSVQAAKALLESSHGAEAVA